MEPFLICEGVLQGKRDRNRKLENEAGEEDREEDIKGGGDKCGESREGARNSKKTAVNSIKGLREMGYSPLYHYLLPTDLSLWKHCYGIPNLLRGVLSSPRLGSALSLTCLI